MVAEIFDITVERHSRDSHTDLGLEREKNKFRSNVILQVLLHCQVDDKSGALQWTK